MIERKTFLAMDFYKKSAFTGSDSGMRYRIAKFEENDEKGLMAWCWPEPMAFASTPEEKIISEKFPYSPEGLEQIAVWLNQMYPVITGEKE